MNTCQVFSTSGSARPACGQRLDLAQPLLGAQAQRQRMLAAPAGAHLGASSFSYSTSTAAWR
jgi:hypothetical protein